MTTNISEILRRVLSVAPLPHTAAEPNSGRSVIVASNGRVLGWVATASGDWRAVGMLWTLAPTVIKALSDRVLHLETERDRYRAAIMEIADYCGSDRHWSHGYDSDDSGARWVTCDGRSAIRALADDALEARDD